MHNPPRPVSAAFIVLDRHLMASGLALVYIDLPIGPRFARVHGCLYAGMRESSCAAVGGRVPHADPAQPASAPCKPQSTEGEIECLGATRVVLVVRERGGGPWGQGLPWSSQHPTWKNPQASQTG